MLEGSLLRQRKPCLSRPSLAICARRSLPAGILESLTSFLIRGLWLLNVSLGNSRLTKFLQNCSILRGEALKSGGIRQSSGSLNALDEGKYNSASKRSLRIQSNRLPDKPVYLYTDFGSRLRRSDMALVGIYKILTKTNSDSRFPQSDCGSSAVRFVTGRR